MRFYILHLEQSFLHLREVSTLLGKNYAISGRIFFDGCMEDKTVKFCTVIKKGLFVVYTFFERIISERVEGRYS